MTLISFKDQPKLLYLIVEDNGQPWLAISTVNSAGATIDSYTPNTFLRDWTPVLANGAQPQ